MEKIEKNKTSRFRMLGITGITLCALCCLLPIAGSIFGLAALASLATHLEKAAIVFLALSAVGFGIYLIRKSRRSKVCATDCSCNPEADNKITL